MHKSKMLAVAGMALALWVAEPVLAHHSYAMFDMNKNITVSGTVKEVQWTNPHIWVQMVTKDPKTGKDVEWSIEGASPNMLIRAGWTRKALKVGDQAVAVIHPLRVGGDGHSGSLASMSVNGRQIFGHQASEGAK